MAQLAERIVSDLRGNGLPLEDAGDGWFALRGASQSAVGDSFLYLRNEDLVRYVDAMTAEDVDGIFGPQVSPDEARYRLTLVHLEEHLAGFHGGTRFVVVNGVEILVFDSSAPPTLPSGEYAWSA